MPYHHGLLNQPDPDRPWGRPQVPQSLISAAEEWGRNPQRSMVSPQGASIGPPQSRMSRIWDHLRYGIPRRVEEFLEPETPAGLAGLLGASVMEPAGTAIDVADFAAGFRDRDLPRMGWAAGGAALPFVGAAGIKGLLRGRGAKAADLKTQKWEGEFGRGDHLTAEQKGTIPVESLRPFRGARDEVRGAHVRREGAEWDEFKADISERGMTDPIFVTVEPNQLPRISEGNHRLDAAVELGMDEVPVEIRYFGKAEDQGSVADRLGQLRSSSPELLEGMDDPAWEGLGTLRRGVDPEGVPFRHERTMDWDYEVPEWEFLERGGGGRG